MIKLNEYNKLKFFADKLGIYPLSIVEKMQSGEVFADDAEDPSAVLFWHYCGFAYISGNYTEDFVNDVLSLMRCPTSNHSGRLVLHTQNDAELSRLILRNSNIQQKERYCFEFAERKTPLQPLSTPLRLVRIDAQNYYLLCGRITPAFSWKSKQDFLHNGFGWCILNGSEFAACAFSSAVSSEFVDIGVETAPAYQGKGLGKIVASAMIDEILKHGKKPLWECNSTNEASKRLALSVGFRISGTHPMFTL